MTGISIKKTVSQCYSLIKDTRNPNLPHTCFCKSCNTSGNQVGGQGDLGLASRLGRSLNAFSGLDPGNGLHGGSRHAGVFVMEWLIRESQKVNPRYGSRRRLAEFLQMQRGLAVKGCSRVIISLEATEIDLDVADPNTYRPYNIMMICPRFYPALTN